MQMALRDFQTTSIVPLHMLRISITESADHSAILRLEGHLGGAWIDELRENCERMLAARWTLALDLGDVYLIERPGFELLASLSHRAVSLLRCSSFQEEQLRQAGAAHKGAINRPA